MNKKWEQINGVIQLVDNAKRNSDIYKDTNSLYQNIKVPNEWFSFYYFDNFSGNFQTSAQFGIVIFSHSNNVEQIFYKFMFG